MIITPIAAVNQQNKPTSEAIKQLGATKEQFYEIFELNRHQIDSILRDYRQSKIPSSKNKRAIKKIVKLLKGIKHPKPAKGVPITDTIKIEMQPSDTIDNIETIKPITNKKRNLWKLFKKSGTS